MCRVLKRVDTERVDAAAQKELSKQDSMEWFISVTLQMYRRATIHELRKSNVLGTDIDDDNFEIAVSRALRQVFSIRSWVGKSSRSESLQKFLSTLLHVKYDFAYPCPVPVGTPILSTCSLVSLERLSEKTSLRKLMVTSSLHNRVTVVVSGSWS